MTTLREAAQRAMKSLEDAIKVWTEEMEFRSCVDASDEWLESYAALREALADQSEQALEMVEPVAWMCSDEELLHKGYSRFSKTCVGEWNIPVYTHPPQRKPLTDEEIVKISDLRSGCYGTTEFARAIERAHGIGEKE